MTRRSSLVIGAALAFASGMELSDLYRPPVNSYMLRELHESNLTAQQEMGRGHYQLALQDREDIERRQQVDHPTGLGNNGPCRADRVYIWRLSDDIARESGLSVRYVLSGCKPTSE